MKQNEEIIEQAVAMLESYFMNYLYATVSIIHDEGRMKVMKKKLNKP